MIRMPEHLGHQQRVHAPLQHVPEWRHKWGWTRLRMVAGSPRSRMSCWTPLSVIAS